MLKSIKKFFICGRSGPKVESDVEPTFESGVGETPSCSVALRHFPLEREYEIVESIGFPGSFGLVSSCRDKVSGTVCAVKNLKVNKSNAHIVQNEIDIMRSLNHPNCVSAKAVFLTKNEVSIVMEKYDGGDLFDAICEKRFVGELASAGIIHQILTGVEYMHNMHLAHCDLKLANILLSDKSSSPLVKIIDFGEAQFCPEGSQLHELVGSPSYMAPEVLSNCYDESCDMWSVGVIAFIFAFGYNPFNPKGKCGNEFFDVIASNIRKGFSPVEKNCYGACFPKSIPLSDQGKDFISKLLTADRRARMTVRQALEHPWITAAVSN